MIIALAGRRIDAENAKQPAFPLENAPLVRQLMRELFERERPDVLICSAACGADLVALDLARELGIASRIVLPYDVAQFRATSVVDRPGDWGRLFDEIVRDREDRELINLELPSGSDETFAATNRAIIEQSQNAAKHAPPAIAVLAWEGKPREGFDLTYDFAELAHRTGMPVREIPTLFEEIQADAADAL